MTTTRETLLARARHQRQEIAEFFADVAQWNRQHPEEEPIDPDPDGQLAEIAARLDQTLGAPPDFSPAGRLLDGREHNDFPEAPPCAT